jgi:hypothetical protein
MTPEMIEKFVATKIRKETSVNIHFKDRDTVNGLFIQANDYEELKSKNFWRIVNHMHADQWKETKDNSLARIFNGASFTRLSEDKES